MTEREFERTTARILGWEADSFLLENDGRVAELQALAKEAGATFDPDREQVWHARAASGHEVRLMVPGNSDGKGGWLPYKWEYLKNPNLPEREWADAGDSLQSAELARRILAEREGAGGGWEERVVDGWFSVPAGCEGDMLCGSRLVAIIRRHAPKVEDVVDAFCDFGLARYGWAEEVVGKVRKACEKAGLRSRT